MVAETVKLRTIPEAATLPLSWWGHFKLWFSVNRQPLGSIILGVSTLVRGFLFLKQHDATADILKGIADLMMGVGGVTYAAGTFMPDKEHLAQAHAEIRRRSGQFPVFDRRAEDRYKVTHHPDTHTPKKK